MSVQLLKYEFIDFVKVTAKISNGNVLVDCNCGTFATPLFAQGRSTCCHSRFMTDIVVGLKSNALPVYLSKSKIEECKQHATKGVFPLPSKDGVD